jgi:hypothetical protein
MPIGFGAAGAGLISVLLAASNTRSPSTITRRSPASASDCRQAP